MTGPMVAGEPTVTEAYGAAWHHLKRTAMPLLGVALAWAVIAVVSGRLQGIASLAWSTLVLGPVGIGASWLFLRIARGETPDALDLFAPYRGDFVRVILAGAIVGAATMIGVALLVVPGLIVAVRLSWTPYLLLDEPLDAMGAVRASWERTRGHGIAIAGILLLGGLVVALGLALLLVGVIPASMWASLAHASYYAAVTDRRRLPAAADRPTVLESSLAPGGSFGGPPPHEPPRP